MEFVLELLAIVHVALAQRQSFYQAQNDVELTKNCSDTLVTKYNTASITECTLRCSKISCNVYIKNGACFCISRECALQAQKVDGSTGVLYSGNLMFLR